MTNKSIKKKNQTENDPVFIGASYLNRTPYFF